MKRIIILIITFCIVSIYTPASLAGNNLKDHPSPYLAMHGNDPVNWQRWDNSIFERAKKEKKLIFVSIGYFACHWCHVMQRESYQNSEIAKIMNREFISVKVDRELRPALDARLINFVEQTRGYAGWPLNVFITPDGYPLVGIVYLPPTDFKSLIENMAQTWKSDMDGMDVMARAAAQAMKKVEVSQGPVLDKKEIAYYQKLFAKQAMQNADYLQGGFGEQSKFPLVPQLDLLLHLYKKNHDRTLGDFLQLTFNKMSSLGLYDHLRGGFFRYVVDPNWQIPHFEKMLYDNVQLISLYLEAGKVFKNEQYIRIAMESIRFLNNELMDDSGAMISSLSAIDDNNVEGGYYLWSDEELKSLLSKQEHQVINLYWGMKHAPELEAGHHPKLDQTVSSIAKEIGVKQVLVEKIISSVKMKLKKQQLNRSLPRDTKILASWNGLALSALVAASKHDKQYALQAEKIKTFILTKLWNGQSLTRASAQGQYLGNATLEDYAYVAQGLFDWVSYSGDKDALRQVSKIVAQAWTRFYAGDGWLLAEGMMPGISAREAIIADGPMPSPSAVLIRVSMKLASMMNDKGMMDLAKSALNRGHETLKTDNFWYATHVKAMSEAVK